MRGLSDSALVQSRIIYGERSCAGAWHFPFSLRLRNWPTGTIVATCNPPDDNQDHGDAVGQDIGEFDARFREHHVDLLDHIIPLSVSDPCS